jgi:hypothetical protein
MSKPFVIPTDQDFIDNLILQRTSPFVKLGGSAALQHWFRTGQKNQLSGFLASRGLLQDYLQAAMAEISAEADQLIAAIPEEGFADLVSIGAGNGLLEVLLARKRPVKRMVLIDIEVSELNQHGFAEQGSGYASLAAAKALMLANGMTAEQVITVNPTHEPLPDMDFSLLLSILSMGFHFPCDDYAPYILKNLRPGGHAVIDKRRGVVDSGFDALQAGLRTVRSEPGEKRDRVYLTRD